MNKHIGIFIVNGNTRRRIENICRDEGTCTITTDIQTWMGRCRHRCMVIVIEKTTYGMHTTTLCDDVMMGNQCHLLHLLFNQWVDDRMMVLP